MSLSSGKLDPERLRNYIGEDEIVSSLELDLRLRNRPAPNFVVRSEIPSLDRLTEGFHGGELITISGKTKGGKTLLAQTLTWNFCAQVEFPLWFSFEVPPRQFLSQFPQLQTFYLPARLKSHDFDWMVERIMESWYKYHTRIIFVDHLHFLFDMLRVKNTSLEIGSLIRRLKSLAVENEFIIFLLCHITKVGKDVDAGFEHLRDSSLIAQESDTVLMVKRTPDKGEFSGSVRVEFHRRTGTMEKSFNIIKRNMLFYELEEEREPF